jgi:hypothetical protein
VLLSQTLTLKTISEDCNDPDKLGDEEGVEAEGGSKEGDSDGDAGNSEESRAGAEFENRAESVVENDDFARSACSRPTPEN